MAAQKQPTNGDILTELKAMNTRLTALESWKIAEDAAKKAVADYRRGEETSTIMDWVGKIAPLTVAVLTALYAYLQVHK